jgi:hypothetical protein
MRSRTFPIVFLLSGLLLLPTPVAHPQERWEGDTPKPYERDEFPEWAWNLRRGEIVAIGAFPVALILTGISYELGRFAFQAVQDGGVTQENAPFFFSPGGGERFSPDERRGLVITSAAISVGIAMLDYFIGRRERTVPDNW